jgi:hypothetical protein
MRKAAPAFKSLARFVNAQAGASLGAWDVYVEMQIQKDLLQRSETAGGMPGGIRAAPEVAGGAPSAQVLFQRTEIG